MNRDNDELIIKGAINSINTPKYDIALGIDKNKAKKSPSFKRHLVTAAVSLIILTFTVTAAAVTITGFKYLVSIIGEENAGVVTPIELSDEDQGIKMEVVAAGRFDNMLKIYVTLQDMTGERLSDDVHFSSYYNLEGIERTQKGNGVSGAGWRMIDYDERNHRATLLYKYNSSGKIEGEELALRINKILYNSKDYWDYKVSEADLSNIDRNPPIFYASMNQILSTSNMATPEGLYKKYMDENAIPLLKEQDNKISFPQTEGFNICAMGIIDGKLHIQTHNFDKTDKDTSYNIYFVDLKNPKPYEELINPEIILRFDPDKNDDIAKGSDFAPYNENVFDIDIDRLFDYELLAYIGESDAVKGEWEVKFTSEDIGEILKTKADMDINGIKVDSISINSFGGVRVEGAVDDSVKIPVMFDVKINTSHDDIEALFSSYNYSEDRTGNLKCSYEAFYETEGAVDLNSVLSIEINGIRIKFDK